MGRKINLWVLAFLLIFSGLSQAATFYVSAENPEHFNITSVMLRFDVSEDFGLDRYEKGPGIPDSWVEEPNPPEVGLGQLLIGYRSNSYILPFDNYLRTGILFSFEYDGALYDLSGLSLLNDFGDDQSQYAFIEEVSQSNMRISFVPLPAAFWLLFSGLIAVVGTKRAIR